MGPLERLAQVRGAWAELAALLEGQLTRGGLDAELEHGYAMRLGRIYEEALADLARAATTFRRAASTNVDEPPALAALDRVLWRLGRWGELADVLAREAEVSESDATGADFLFRLANAGKSYALRYRLLGALAPIADGAALATVTAASHYRQALTHDARHAPAIAALERLARADGNWATVADMLAKRVAIVEADGGDVLPLALEYAAAERQRGTPAAALPVLERAAALAPGDVRVLTPLADLYFSAGQLDRAAPIYDKLAEDAKAARRMKDVARYRQRQGGILEARGDAAGAVAAYEEAFRVNPTDVPTMAGLGRLAMAQRDWEKARRVYRSLVLQNLDADAGVTKADVYYALGVIHVELGEGPKAKGMFQRGLEMDPADQRLKDALAKLAGTA